MADITIYTDGSANNSTHSKGGYGIVMINGTVSHYAGGSYSNTTSARMEIMAIIKALCKCEPGDTVTVWSDNQYAVNTLHKQWIFRWEQDKFFGRKNKDLWKAFLVQYRRLNGKVTLRWVRGHDGHEHNEAADRLARIGSLKARVIVDNTHRQYQ